MADVSRGVRGILGVFGPIYERATRAGRGAAQMWDAYKSAYQALGVDRPPATLGDMNTFVKWLGQVLTSSRTLTGAADNEAFAGDHIAPPTGQTKGTTPGTVPRVLVSYQFTATRGDEPFSGWRTLSYTGQLPATVGELRGDVDQEIADHVAAAALNPDETEDFADVTDWDVADMYAVGYGM